MAEPTSAPKIIKLLEILLQGQKDMSDRLEVMEEQLYKLDEIDSNQREIQAEVDTLSKTIERTHRYLRQISKHLDNNSFRGRSRSSSVMNLSGLSDPHMSHCDSDDSDGTVQGELSDNKARKAKDHPARPKEPISAKFDNDLTHQNIPQDNVTSPSEHDRKIPSPAPNQAAAMATSNIPVKPPSFSSPSVLQNIRQPVHSSVSQHSDNNMTMSQPKGPHVNTSLPSHPQPAANITRQSDVPRVLSQISTESGDRSVAVDFTSPESYLKSIDITVTDQNMLSAVRSVFTEDGPDPSMANIPGLRTVVLLDTSSSVNDHMMNDAKKFLGHFVDEVENSASDHNLEESMAIAQFGGKCAILQGLTNDYEPLKNATDHMVRGGKSPLLIGLVMVTAYLRKYGKSVDIEGRTVYPRIIVVSDGLVTNHHNVGTEQDVESNSIRCKSKVLEFLNVTVQLGFTVSCVGIGEYDKNFLTNISQTQCKGRFYDGHIVENAQLLGRYYRYQKFLTRIEKEMAEMGSSKDLVTTVNNVTGADSTLADIDREEIIKLCKTLLNLKIPNVPMPSPNSSVHPGTQTNIARRPEVPEPPSLGGWESDDESPELREVDLQQCGRTLQYGTRVKKGDNIPGGSHGEDDIGTVVAHRGEGRVVVKWDSRQYGTYDQNHLTKVSEYRKLGPAQDIEVGCKVKRGIHWNRGDEDGGANTEGVVLRKHRDKTVTVFWPSTIIERYKFGKNEKFELEVVTEHQEEAVNLGYTEPLTSDETVVAWQWKDDQNQWRTLPEEESTKIQKHVDDGRPGTVIVKHFGIQLRCDPLRLKFKEMGGRDRSGEMRRYDVSANEVATLRFIEQNI